MSDLKLFNKGLEGLILIKRVIDYFSE